MEALNVLVIVPSFDRTVPHVDEEILRRIAEVSPRINVRDGSALAHAEFHGDTTAREELNTMLAEAEVVYGLFLPRDLLSTLCRYRYLAESSDHNRRQRHTRHSHRRIRNHVHANVRQKGTYKLPDEATT